MFSNFFSKKKTPILEAINQIKSSLIELDISSAEPKEINWDDYINTVSSEAYTQFGKETYVRAIKDSSNIIYDKEKEYTKEIETVDFHNNYVLFVIFTSKSYFPSHYHNSLETIKCLEGAYIGMDNEVYLRGETQVIPAGKPHVFRGVTNGACLVTIAKK